MHVTEIANQDLTREYKIVFPIEGINDKIHTKLLDLAKTMKMPGFRPGKIPFEQVKKRHFESAKWDVVEKAINEAIHAIVTDNKLNLASQGKIDIVAEEEGKDLEYKVVFEVLPDIAFPDFSMIELDGYKYDIPQKEIDNELSKIANRLKKFEKSDDIAAAIKGHAVLIDFEGKIDGVAFAGGTAQDFQLELGSGQFIKGFEEQLIGSKIGDQVAVKVTFPENYGNAEVAGKEAEFDVVVKAILAAEDIMFDDEFAKKFGMETMNEFHEKIKERIAEGYNQLVYIKQKKDLFDKLDQDLDFLVPNSMFENEFKELMNKATELKKENPKFSDKTDQELEDEYKNIAKRRVKLGIFLSELAKADNIVVTGDDIKGAISSHAMQFPGQEANVVKFYQQNHKAMESLRGPIIEDKVVKSILAKVKLNEQKTTTKKLLDLMKEAETND